MLAYLPPRDVTDRIVAKFYQSNNPALVLFHIPTLLKEYEKFWEDPSQATYNWLALLFAMVSHAARLCSRGDDQVPGNLGSPDQSSTLTECAPPNALPLETTLGPASIKLKP
jgi:hypothetical protein